MIYYVESNAPKNGDGSQNKPFNMISQAAKIAAAGDEIIVGAGIYREAVSPANSGKEDSRIVYRAKEKGAAVITGAEEWKNWESEGGGVWSEGNVYYNGAKPWKNEKNSCVSKNKVSVDISKKPDGWYISSNIDISKEDYSLNMINTGTLGKAFEPDAKFENPDGSEIVFDTDCFGNKRDGGIIPGPFAADDLIDKRLPI